MPLSPSEQATLARAGERVRARGGRRAGRVDRGRRAGARGRSVAARSSFGWSCGCSSSPWRISPPGRASTAFRDMDARGTRATAAALDRVAAPPPPIGRQRVPEAADVHRLRGSGLGREPNQLPIDIGYVRDDPPLPPQLARDHADRGRPRRRSGARGRTGRARPPTWSSSARGRVAASSPPSLRRRVGRSSSSRPGRSSTSRRCRATSSTRTGACTSTTACSPRGTARSRCSPGPASVAARSSTG